MEEARSVVNARIAGKLLRLLLFCVLGIIVNFLGAQVALGLRLPIYLDAAGTILAAVFGGYVPGILVGYFTNFLLGAFDASEMYFGTVNALIALMAAYFAQRGWFRRPATVALAIVAFALVGGGLGSALSWCLNGFGFGDGSSAALAQRLYDDGLGMLPAWICAGLLADLVDKTIVVLFAVLVVNLVPDRFAKLWDFSLWQQAPLTDEERGLAKDKMSRRASLRTKIVMLVSVVMVVVTVVTAGISFVMYHRSNIDVQAENGLGIVGLMAEAVDADRVQEFVDGGDDAEGYAETEAALAAIGECFPDVEYLYVYQILEDGCHVVFDLDTEDTPGSDPGDVVPFDEAFEPYLPALLAGEPIDPIVSDETYGWLLTVYQPVYGSDGRCACYVAADISMADLLTDELGFLARVISLFVGFFIVICAIALWLADYSLILPVNSIALSSSAFAFEDEDARTEGVENIRRLDIRTGDEVENLYRAVAKTSEDTLQFIAASQEKSETIERMQSNLIMVMADLVESRDKYTGDHIRKTAAYVRIILGQMREEGVYADQLTDEFIANTIRSAPLHDIGKIMVPDSILNKPGKLTDEEFKIMQNHTLAGRDILRSAVGAVSDSSYLDEAQNLAAYHHEKWNGKGYPSGLAGEDIPLSARVMAVADVFDALVSKRSYKEGFPIEKALDIIREGIGSHFDPQVAAAFLHAEEEVRRVAETHGDGTAARGDDGDERP